MSDDTTRRERAEKSLNGGMWGAGDEHPWAQSVADQTIESHPVARGFLYGYLAGAREQEEINTAEVNALRQEVGNLQRAIRSVLDYHEGGGEYDFHNLPLAERENRAFDAWQAVKEGLRLALEAKS